MIKVSVVICVYNEEESVKLLIDKIASALSSTSFEIIFVDDGSTDNTENEILTSGNKDVILISLKKNYGQSSALAAGINHAKGKYIVLLDGDLQNDPADIPMMLEKAEKEDWDLVAGYRKDRKDGMLFRKIPSMIANFLIRRVTKVKIKDYGCTLKLFKNDLAKDINLYGELHRFIPVLASLEGAKITQVEVNHLPRQFGKSKYGINRTFKVLADLFLMVFIKKYLQKPMHLFGTWGIFILIIGIIINLYLFILKIFGYSIWGKPLLLLGILFVIAGFQLITIGLFADLLMRTYYESQNKTPYRIKNIIHVAAD